MDFNINFQYPTWFLLFCLLLGLMYAIVLYFKDNRFEDVTKTQKRLLPLLFIFRFLGVSAISSLLLGPLLKSRIIDEKKPIIIVAQDASASIKGGEIEPLDTIAFTTQLQNIQTQLGEKFEIHPLHYSDEVKDGFATEFVGKSTNISKLFDFIGNRFYGQNVGAVIIASDGIYNEGSHPLYNNANIDVPVYAIAMGDTTAKKDLKIEKVLHNRIAYLNDEFVIRADVSGYRAKGTSSVLSIYRKGNKVFSKTIKFKSDNYFVSEEIKLKADKEGIATYWIQIAPVENETTTVNNTQSIHVEVLKGRQKILLLANSPHPDIAALTSLIEKKQNYELEVAMISNFSKNVSAYDLVIFHGLPSVTKNIRSMLSTIENRNISSLFILTSQTDVSQFNQAQKAIKLNGSNGTSNLVTANFNNGFNIFTFNRETADALSKLPPLQAPYGQFNLQPNAQALFKQSIGSVTTEYPLMAILKSNKTKQAVLCGEGLWLWKMYDLKDFQTDEHLEEMISKTIQYLVIKEDKRKFRVHQDKPIFNENEAIKLDAELYNDSYELINDADVQLTIKNEKDESFPFTFNKTFDSYELNAGLLPTGDYTYTANVSSNGENLGAKGAFTIKEIQVEMLQTTANHKLLYQISEKTDGGVYSLDNAHEIVSVIQNRPDIKPIQYSSFANKEIINLKWLFFLLLGFFAVEWFIRKWLGGY